MIYIQFLYSAIGLLFNALSGWSLLLSGQSFTATHPVKGIAVMTLVGVIAELGRRNKVTPFLVLNGGLLLLIAYFGIYYHLPLAAFWGLRTLALSINVFGVTSMLMAMTSVIYNAKSRHIKP